ncbi:MAG: hypothetical protein JNL83_11820 [Myxococcales bacterium]|nr:hypothetical protein [Myxococcales bacterium]
MRIDKREARSIMAKAREGARLVDASHIVRTRLLGRNTASQKQEWKLPRRRDFDTLCRFVDEVREYIEGDPFVYVVWAQSPEEYLYVGHSQNKSGRNDRLNLDSRGKLKGAMELGSTFTLLFPLPISDTVAKDVEAAILELLNEQDRFPRYNEKFERVPGALGSSHLGQIGDMLRALGDEFRPAADAMTQVVR